MFLPGPSLFFFFNDTATTEIYTLSLHDALPIYRNGNTDHAVAVQILVEGGFQRFQRGAGSRHDTSEVQTSVLQSHWNLLRGLILAQILPGHFVAACRLLRPYRRPAAKLTRDHGCASIFQLGARPAFFFNDTATTEIYTLSLHDALPIYRNGNTDHAVAVQILVEGGFQRFQRGAGSRHD